MARDDRGICLQRGRRRGEREREGKSLDDTRNRGISRCFNNRAGFDKSVTSMNFCRALEFFAGQRWWWWWWWVGLSRSRDVSRKIHFTVLHAAVLPTACRRKITKKKEKGEGGGDRKKKKRKKKRANRSSEARPLRFIIRPSPLRDPLRGFPSIGRASLFLASSLRPSPALATLDLAPPRPRSVCHFHPDDGREMESYWMKQRERMKRGRGRRRRRRSKRVERWITKKGNELFSSIRHGRTHTPWTRRTRGVS